MITHLDIQMSDYKFQEITAEYEYPKDDYNSLTSQYYEAVPFHSQYQVHATTSLPLEQNKNSDYVD